MGSGSPADPQDALARARAEIEAASGLESLEQIRLSYLGRKGLVPQALRDVSSLPKEERPRAGQAWNEVRRALETAVEERQAALKNAEAAAADASFDPTLPGRRPALGLPHVLRTTLDDLVAIFQEMGFSVADGPEVEDTSHNFEALNIPEDHPTRDDHDSFFLSPDLLLRTQISPVQVHVMETHRPPLRIVSPGRVYRRDAFDASHSPFFFQMEGLYVADRVTLADLKGTLRRFVDRFFGERVKMRFRGSYFPFTEPSLEVDISCTVCGGTGCPVCKHTGWVEILGCGMVHPNVLRRVGYDPDQVSGWAFGMGPDRIAMLRYRINDIRHFYENDVRFLRQFEAAK